MCFVIIDGTFPIKYLKSQRNTKLDVLVLGLAWVRHYIILLISYPLIDMMQVVTSYRPGRQRDVSSTNLVIKVRPRYNTVNIIPNAKIKSLYLVQSLISLWCYLLTFHIRLFLLRLLHQFSPFRYFPNFPEVSKRWLPFKWNAHIWQVSLWLNCNNTCQISMWSWESNSYFC